MTQRLHKEHITLVTPSGDSQTVSELLQWSLDMIKTRLSVMPQDTRKAFLNILTSLIEKSPDPKLLKVVTKMVEEWVKAKVRMCVGVGGVGQVCVCVCVWVGGVVQG